jgi:hypothetical protein
MKPKLFHVNWKSPVDRFEDEKYTFDDDSRGRFDGTYLKERIGFNREEFRTMDNIAKAE